MRGMGYRFVLEPSRLEFLSVGLGIAAKSRNMLHITDGEEQKMISAVVEL